MSVLWECYSSCCSILHFLKKMLQGHKDSQTFVDISSGSALGGLQEFKHMAVFSCMREWAVSEKSSLWLQNSLSHHKVLCGFFFWPKSNLFSLYFYIIFFKATAAFQQSWYSEIFRNIFCCPPHRQYLDLGFQIRQTGCMFRLGQGKKCLTDHWNEGYFPS